nr:uncharacterized protein LOC109994455 isoform X2 [Labrus bergylta]XP_020503475.1 uncharacterized protein LOC109994455 isoform X3 [Labrus bergylta]
MKDCETKTGLRVLPSVQSVFQSAPAVWYIDLSKRKTSILLEVLRLRPEKTPVELTGCPDEESEVRSFLQCLPHISQLSFSEGFKRGVELCGRLFCAAAEREQQTGENTLQLLSSLCTYETFPISGRYIHDDTKKYQCSFLLDLYSHMKNYETKTGLRVLPSVQSVFQSAPAVWYIDLSKRKTSILLEVLRLRPEKTPVKLTGCPDEESEVRSFLQCLPHISQLSFSEGVKRGVEFCGRLFCAAAEREQQTGENTMQLLSSVCRYEAFSYLDEPDFFLDLCSHMKDYETKTGLRVLPSLQSVFQSAPDVWYIDLSKRKTSILLEVLRLRPEKTPVELTGCPDEESEVRSFLQCLPHISQLSFYFSFSEGFKRGVELCGRLFCAAAEREQQTGENTLQLLSSLCTYETFPISGRYIHDDTKKYQCSFLLDLCSHMKDCETKTGLRVLPSLQSVFQSAPAVWYIDLSKRKTSILLEVLRLRPEKTPVELTGCPDEESEVRSFLQCLPHISQLSCSQPEFFQLVCTSVSVRSRDEAETLVPLLRLLGFTLQLTGTLLSKTCKSVGRVLGLCGSRVDLILTPRMMSVRGASLLFRHTKKLHSLRLSNSIALLLSGWVRRQRVPCLTVTEQLSLASQSDRPSEKVFRVVSSLASLLRYWTVRQLDLTESWIPPQCLFSLLSHDGPLTIKLNEKTSRQLLDLLHETQDNDLTLAFLRKVNGDLTPFCLNWELLQRLLQQSSQMITVNMRKNSFLQESITRLLPFLGRIVFVRTCPSFVLTSLREIYTTRVSSVVPSLLRSFDHVINLTCREMDSEDCAALLFTLKHSDGVKLNLLWTSIPTVGLKSILCTLDKVSQLSVDRNLLLKFIHCCAASDDQQRAAVSLLRTLQHRLDLSCSSCVEMSEEGQSETFRLTVADCSAVSTILRHSSQDTELHLQDCDVEDSGLDLLFPVLDRVRLRFGAEWGPQNEQDNSLSLCCSCQFTNSLPFTLILLFRVNKVVLLQLVSLVPLINERYSMRRAGSLCKALGGELDLSHTVLDQKACGALAWMLDFSEGLTELDLSHCQLTDQLLLTIKEHLHKVQVLDLSHNKISDASTSMLLELISINPSIETVRLFRNNIVNQTPFKKTKKFEIW